MRRYLAGLTLVLTCSLFLASCHDNNNAPDVSGIQVPFRSYDFYKDFSAVDSNNIARDLQQLERKYPTFLSFYLDALVGLSTNGVYSDTSEALHFFIAYKDFRQLFDTVNKVYPDTKDIDKQLTRLFQYTHYYDSSIVIPKEVYYYAAGLHLAVFTREQTLGIGLDMFLGRNFAPYEMVGIPYFRTIRHTRENIPVAAAKALYESKYPPVYDDKNLLALMIQQGKELYFMKKVLPGTADSLLLGYTAAQMQWCREQEQLIYNFFIKEQFLYETNQQKVMRYVTDGPSSAGMPPESPGNTGSYIGLRIIEQYAETTHASLADILKVQDAQKILQEAKYKP